MKSIFIISLALAFSACSVSAYAKTPSAPAKNGCRGDTKDRCHGGTKDRCHAYEER